MAHGSWLIHCIPLLPRCASLHDCLETRNAFLISIITIVFAYYFMFPES